jgi:pyrroloquinoline quinone (PQQ) biosynthesis protein C
MTKLTYHDTLKYSTWLIVIAAVYTYEGQYDWAIYWFSNAIGVLRYA